MTRVLKSPKHKATDRAVFKERTMTKEFSPMTSDSPETTDTQAVDENTIPTDETPTGNISNTSNENQDQFQEKNEAVHEPLLLSTTHTIPDPLLNFQDVGFSSSLQNILTNAKWKTPRPLDGMALPHALVGEDLVIQAASKTSAIIFLTLAHRLERFKDITDLSQAPQALVIYSSTDSASKACQDYIRLFGDMGLSASVVTEDYEQENEEGEAKEAKAPTTLASNIIFASPSSLKNAHARSQISLKNIMICICRDIDDVKDVGTSEDLEFILSQIGDAQKILFSRTISTTVEELSSKFLKNPKHISLERERATISSVSHHAFLVETPNKFKTLLGLLKDQAPKCAIIFANNKLTAAWLYHKLNENSFAVEQITSDLSPQKRTELTENVQSGKTKLLVSTDFDGRNFTFPEISHVFNFDLPENGDAYLNRMGQVGKEGQGFVYSLVCDEYGQNYQHVYDLLGQKAPKPVWAKEEYLSIADKSGNPFLEKDLGFMDKRPGRDFGDRPRRGHDGDRGDRPSFQRNRERPDRGDHRSDRGERSERPERMGARGPRIEERQERFERIERNDREHTPRGERIERNDRIIRNDRGDRDDHHRKSSGGPQIKPRTRRVMHTPAQSGPIQQRRVTPKETKKGILSKIVSFFFSKKN